MNTRVVLPGGEFVRYRFDCTPIESMCCPYVLARLDDGWRIVTMMPHPPTNLLPQAPGIPGGTAAPLPVPPGVVQGDSRGAQTP